MNDRLNIQQAGLAFRRLAAAAKNAAIDAFKSSVDPLPATGARPDGVRCTVVRGWDVPGYGMPSSTFHHKYARWGFRGGFPGKRVLFMYAGPGRGRFKVTEVECRRVWKVKKWLLSGTTSRTSRFDCSSI